MAFELYPTDRIPRTYTLSPVDATGAPTTVTAARYALLPARQRPAAATAWTAVTVTANKFPITYAGAAADPTGATVVPPGDWDLYVRGIDGTTYDDAEKVERITAY